MQQIPRIFIQQLQFNLPNSQVLLKDLSMTFAHQKIGLVGRNGTGKSTLLKLMTGEFKPHSGSILLESKIAYVPQTPIINADLTIAEFLNLADKLYAIERIENGSIDENDFAILNDEWDIRERFRQTLCLFGLDYLAPNHLLSHLSGGETTRLWLTKVFSSDANFILLDEPSNHLDSIARAQLYSAIQHWQGGMIVASHDRALLNLMDEIIELSALGIKSYGGNFDAYFQQKNLEKQAAEQMLQARREIVEKSKHLAQTRRERHEQNEAKGRRAKKAQIIAKGRYDKLEFNSAKGRSEQTNRRIRLQAERKIDWVETELKAAKEKIEIVDEIKVHLPKTHVPNGKIVVEIKDLNFLYSNKIIFKNFNLYLAGAERIALTGANGSGKTTLVKLILNELQPHSGEIYLGTDRICYLDQTTQQLNSEISILENFLFLNPEASENEAYMALAKFLFKNKCANKLVKDLSGGEKLRALLACVLMAKNPPQLLILDEPTNHLDLNSIESIESALKNFAGAMIVISHDKKFLENILVQRHVILRSMSS